MVKKRPSAVIIIIFLILILFSIFLLIVLPKPAITTKAVSSVEKQSKVIPSHSSFKLKNLIFPTSAYELNSEKVFIEDVYEYIRYKDNFWKAISQDNYIRVTFEKNLTNKNDIRIYAKSNQSNKNASVEIYEKNSNFKLADFGIISNEKEYKALLNNLIGIQDTFDLKVIGGNIWFDYIIDPVDYICIDCGFFTGTEDTVGTDFNADSTYSALEWSNQNYDSGAFSYSALNPTRIQVQKSGNYFLALSLPIEDASGTGSNNNRLAIEAAIYVDGVRKQIGTSRNSYMRGTDNTYDHFQTGDSFVVLVPDVSAGSYIEIYVRGIADTSEAVKANDAFALFLNYIEDSEEIFFATGTTINAPSLKTNLNQGNQAAWNYDMEWKEAIEDNPFTHDDSLESNKITLSDIGYYYVTVNIPQGSSTARTNVGGRIELDGAVINGGTFMQGYIRNAEGHSDSSIHWAGLVETTSNNQNLTVGISRMAQSGTVTTDNLNATIYVRKIANGNSGLYHSTATQVTGTNPGDWNPDNTRYAIWESDNEKDTSYYSHVNGDSNITINREGYYLLSFNSPQLNSSTLRNHPQFDIYVNGETIPGGRTGSTYIRNGNGHDESTTMITYLLNLSEQDNVSVGVVRGDATLDGTVNILDEAVILLEYKQSANLVWNTSWVNFGALVQSNGNKTQVASISSISYNKEVNLTCTGNCSQISTNWTNGTDLNDGEVAIVEFTCLNNSLGDFSASYNVSSLNDTSPDTIVVDCTMLSSSSVLWNQSFLDLGSVYDAMQTNLNASVNSAGSNDEINITEIGGTGTSFISATPLDIGSMVGGEIQDVLFNCSPPYGQTPGDYYALYNVNSSADPIGDNITINCSVVSSFVEFNQSFLSVSPSYSGTSKNSVIQIISTGYNEEITLKEFSGNGSSFTSSNSTNFGILQNQETQEILFTCSPLENQNSGSYSTIYNINSTYNIGNNVTVNCDVLNPLIYINQSDINISGRLNLNENSTQVILVSMGVNNNTFVNCVSGDCSKISNNWTESTNLGHTQNSTLNFTCDDSSVGEFSAIFNVNSTQNSTGSNISVDCEILQTHGNMTINLIYPFLSQENYFDSYSTFFVNATIECNGTQGASCGEVFGFPRYNSTEIYGQGSLGEETISNPDTIINNYTFINISSKPGVNSISVNDSSEFTVGEEVLIIQTQSGGTTCVAGVFEFKNISSINGNNITFDSPLENAYCYNSPNTVSITCSDTSGFESSIAQVVKVPHYTNLTINSGASITAPSWNGYYGGIVAFRASENVVVNGVINVTGKGYRGGDDGYADDAEGGQGEGIYGRGYNPPFTGSGNWSIHDGYCVQEPNNAGGAGSWCRDDNGGDPGAGGGHGTVGESVSQQQGDPDGTSEGGEVIGSPNLSKMFFGGGGGAGSDNDNFEPEGDGGAGGGIVYVVSRNFQGNIVSNGQAGFTSTASGYSAIGGGGAGGTIWIRAENMTLDLINASGGRGAEDADEPGGIGGQGRVRLDFLNSTGTSTPEPGYNGSLFDMLVIKPTLGTYPFFAESSPGSCGILYNGDSCNLGVLVNSTEEIDSFWKIDMLVTSSGLVEPQFTSSSNITINDLPPNAFLVKPLNDTSSSNITQNMTVNASDAVGLENLTFFIFNESGSEINKTTWDISGKSILTGILYTFSYDGIFNWFYRVFDIVGNFYQTQNNTFILDTPSPNITFTSLTKPNNTFISEDSITLGVSVNQTFQTNITFYLYNSTNLVKENTFDDGTRSLSWTLLPDEIYYYNATVFDSFGNINSTNTRRITLDNLQPIIDYEPETIPDYSNKSQNFIYVNVSVTELNQANITYELFNETHLINSTIYDYPQSQVNFTDLSDGKYYFNVTVFDKSYQYSSTDTREILLDNEFPLIDFISPTLENTTKVSRNYLFINISVIEDNERNITFELYNGSGLWNRTETNDNQREINFTNLADGWYEFNVSICDLACNYNVTETRRIYLDTINPNATLISPINNTYSNETQQNLTVLANDTNELSNITLFVFNESNDLINQTTWDVSGKSILTGIIYTFAYEGFFNWFYRIFDVTYNSYETENNTIVIDTTIPLIDFISPTLENTTKVSRNYLFINISVIEDNERNITFELYNGSGLWNRTETNDNQREINFTNLADGWYEFNVSICDLACNYNVTETRRIYLDTINPNATLISPINNTYSNETQQNLTVLANDTNELSNITLFVFNESNDLINQTTWDVSGKSILTGIIYTFAYEGFFNWFYRIFDVTYNSYETENNTIVIDTTIPLIDFSSGVEDNYGNFSRDWIYVNVSATENNFANITFELHFSGGLINKTIFTDNRREINFTGLPDRKYFYNVTIIDLAYNLNYTETREIQIDDTPPIVNIVEPQPKAYAYNESIPLKHTIVDNLIGYDMCWWNLDNTGNETINCGTNTTFDTSDGQHNIYFFANDTLGNLRAEKVSFGVSTQGPAMVLVSPLNNTFFNTPGNFQLNYTAEGPEGMTNCTLYGDWGVSGWHLNETTKGSDWWNETFLYRKKLNVTAVSSVTTNYTVGVVVDTVGPEFQDDGDDIRVTYWNGTENLEIDRLLLRVNNTETIVQFRLQSNLPSNSSDENYSIYYGNPTASNPPDNGSVVWYFYEDFSQGNLNRWGYSSGLNVINTSFENPWTGLNYTLEMGRCGNSFIKVLPAYFPAQRDLQIRALWIDNPYLACGSNPESGSPDADGILGLRGSASGTYDGILVERDTDGPEGFQYDQGASGSADTGIYTDQDSPFEVWQWTESKAYGTSYTGHKAKYWNYTQVEPDYYQLQATAVSATSPGLPYLRVASGTAIVAAVFASVLVEVEPNVTIQTEYWEGSFDVSIEDDGIYNWNVECFDNNHVGSFAIFNNTFSIDTQNPNISYTQNTLLNNTNFSRNYIFVEVSANETNEQNITFALYNQTGPVNISTYTDFRRTINWSSLPQGNYRFNVTIFDKANNSNFTETRRITIDTTLPSGTLFSPEDGAALGNTTQNFTIIANDTNSLSNITLFIYNEVGNLINQTTRVVAGTGAIIGVTYTFLTDGVFNWFARIFDVASNEYETSNNTLTIDTQNPYISYQPETLVNNSNASQNFIYINVSVIEQNEANITFRLYNSTGLYYSNFYTNPQRIINYTNLKNGIYYYNVTVFDDSGRFNSTPTRKLTLDTVKPNLTLISPDNDTYTNQALQNLSLNITDENTLSDLTLYIFNETHSEINQTTWPVLGGNSILTGINFTFPYQGIFYWGYSSSDVSGNTNFSRNNTFILDQTNPLIEYSQNTFPDYANRSDKWIFINVTVIETNEQNITFYLYKQGILLINSTYTNKQRARNFTGLSDGNYSYNVTVFDKSFQYNSTTTRNIVLDTQFPNVTQLNPEQDYFTNQFQQNFTYNSSDKQGLNTSTLFIFNESGSLVYNITQNLFATKSIISGNIYNFVTDGIFNWFYRIFDISGNKADTNNRTITLDLSLPQITFVPLTKENDSSFVENFIYINVTVEEENEENITFYLYNSTHPVYENFFINQRRNLNWTLLPDDIYYYNVSAYDSAGNLNTSETRWIILDNLPPQVDYTQLTFPNHINVSRDFIFVNVSVNETNEQNITYRLHDFVFELNVSTYTNKIREINWTDLDDKSYYYNVTVFDRAGQKTVTETRELTIDTIYPLIEFGLSTPQNYKNISQSYLYFDVIASDDNEANITFKLYNEDGPVNVSTYEYSKRTINYTGIPYGNVTYYYNVTINDFASNENYTQTREIFLFDSIKPYVEIINPEERNYTSNESLPLDFIASDPNLDSCRYSIDGAANITINNCQNTSFSVSDESWHTIYLFVNDTSGNKNNTKVTFYVNSTDIQTPDYKVQRDSTFVEGSETVFIEESDPKKSFFLLNSRTTSSAPSAIQVIPSFVDSEEIRFENYGGSTTVDWELISGPDIYVQRGEYSYSDTEVNVNISISEINLSSSFILIYNRLNDGTPANNSRGKWTGKFINSTFIQLDRGESLGTQGELSWQVVDWDSVTVKRGLFVTSGSSGFTGIGATIKFNETFLIFSERFIGSNTLESTNLKGNFDGNQFLEFQRVNSGGTAYAEWFVVSSPVFEVQNGSFTISNTNDPVITELQELFNYSRAFNRHSKMSTGSGTTYANSIVATKIPNATHLETNIGSSASNTRTVNWQVIELIEKNAPTVNLFTLNLTNFSSNIVILNYTVEDQNSITNCTLYGNWTDGWKIKSFNDSQERNILSYFKEINVVNDGDYKWNVRCTDLYGNVGENSTNFTFSAYLSPEAFNENLFNITETRNDGNGEVNLSWNASNHSIIYYIHYTDNLSVGFSLLGETSDNYFTDNSSNQTRRRFYRVSGWNPSGENFSSIYGKTIYYIKRKPNVNTRNWIGFYLENNLTNANESLNTINNISSFTTFNSTTQTRVTCNLFSCPDFPACTSTNCNFDLKNATGYEINANSSFSIFSNWSTVGKVKQPVSRNLVRNSSSFGKNWVSMQYNTTMTKAYDLLNSINWADVVTHWDTLEQTSRGYLDSPFPWVPYIGTNFDIQPEIAYEVSIQAPTTYTQT